MHRSHFYPRELLKTSPVKKRKEHHRNIDLVPAGVELLKRVRTEARDFEKETGHKALELILICSVNKPNKATVVIVYEE